MENSGFTVCERPGVFLSRAVIMQLKENHPANMNN